MKENKRNYFDLDEFVRKHVIRRDRSMFLEDIEAQCDRIGKAVEGRSMLVIGGAGSIGSSFIKAVLLFGPKELVIVDINENALTELTRDLRSEQGMVVPERYVTYAIDYASPVFKKMFRDHGGFDIVLNFSAHKHVRSEKDIYSIEAMLRNNVMNVKGLLEILCEFPPESYFCVSTDKAANPVSIMGASKRLMEDLIFSYSDRFPVKTARFANVAFSNGSLPAGFLERIRRQQPISAPTDVRRYFVSQEESGQICMLACMLGANREIFFPRLEKAQMMTFDAIAVELLNLHGYEALTCNSEAQAMEKTADLKKGSCMYPVYFSKSDTDGEKQYEEFYTETEAVDQGRFKMLGVITGKTSPDRQEMDEQMERLEAAFQKVDVTKEDIVGILKSCLPYFEHIETGRSLDSRM